MNGFSLDLANQLGAAGEITPLVRTTGVQSASVLTVKLKIIQALQDLVRELSVRNTFFRV